VGENPTVKELIDYEAFCGITPEQILHQSGLEITPEELKEKLENGEDIILIDVREPVEYEINRIEGSKLIPLSKLPEKVNELDQTREIVLYCKMGGRSARAVQLLRELGFTRVKNLAGGIDAWIEKIDPTMPRY
jgi:rhodanese-related sulfurtransferase